MALPSKAAPAHLLLSSIRARFPTRLDPTFGTLALMPSENTLSPHRERCPMFSRVLRINSSTCQNTKTSAWNARPGKSRACFDASRGNAAKLHLTRHHTTPMMPNLGDVKSSCAAAADFAPTHESLKAAGGKKQMAVDALCHVALRLLVRRGHHRCLRTNPYGVEDGHVMAAGLVRGASGVYKYTLHAWCYSRSDSLQSRAPNIANASPASRDHRPIGFDCAWTQYGTVRKHRSGARTGRGRSARAGGVPC